jgi:hypothetical protein
VPSFLHAEPKRRTGEGAHRYKIELPIWSNSAT